MKTGFHWLVLGLGLLSVAQAGDLMDNYKMAVDSDPQLAQAEANRLAVAESRPQALSLLLPAISFDADTVWNELTFKGFGSPDTDRDFNSHGWRLQLLQPVFDYEAWLQLRQTDSIVAQAIAQYRAADQGLMLRLSQRYFAVLSAIDDLAAANAELKAVGRQLDQVKQRFEVGLVAITDVHEAQARYDSTVSLVIRAENAVNNAREQLREVTGHYDDNLAVLEGDIPLLPPDPANRDEWEDMALTQNPQVLAASLASETARQQIDIERSGHLPTVDLFASAGEDKVGGGRFGGGSTRNDAIGLQFSAPIYLGGAVVSRTREALYRFDEATSAYDQQRREVTRQTREAYNNVVSIISDIKALQQTKVAAQSALEATEAGYDVGTRTIVDVLNRQRELTEAQVNWSRRRYDYLVETLRLKQATGILDVVDLEGVNELLRTK